MGEVSPSAATACAATLSAGLAPRNAPAKEPFPDLRCAVDRVIPLPLWLIETLVTLPLPQEFYLAAGSLGSGPRFPQSPCLVLQKNFFGGLRWRLMGAARLKALSSPESLGFKEHLVVMR